MDPNEFYEYEGRYYQSPTLTRDETLGFVDQLRDTVRQNNAEIASSTQALGTNVPSNLGGLTGANGYFAQRYQTAPIETQVNTLRATAQADALNKLMTNYKNQAANRYQQAYRRAKGATTPAANVGNSELEFNVNGGGEKKRTKVSTTDWQTQLNSLNSEPGGQLYFYTYRTPYKDPVKIYVNNLTGSDDMNAVLRELGNGYNGQIKTLNGVRYIYVDDGKFAPSWYRVGASSVPGGL